MAGGSARARACRRCSTRTAVDPEKLAHWQAADAAFDQWLDLSDPERDDWLATQAFPEPVRRRLLQLVAAHRKPRAALAPVGDDLAGRLLGDWTLDDELGRGGMQIGRATGSGRGCRYR